MSSAKPVPSNSPSNMQQEVEIKFLNADHGAIRMKLQELGGTCIQQSQQMRRAVMDFPDNRLKERPNVWSWIRIRDEGKRVTVTYKQVSKDGKYTTHEIEYETSSY